MVTVVITTCKRKPEILHRAIKSVEGQTYTNWELIVVDDSPPDWPQRHEVGRTVRSIFSNNRIVYIENKSNSGACYSRNEGLKLANGEYIAYLDDDDEWLPEKLQKQVEALDMASDDVALVYGPFYEQNEETKEIKQIDVPLLSGFLYEELMKQGNFFGGMSMPMMRTKCVIDIGGFDEMMQAVQDMDLWLRIAQKYRVISISTPLINYHVYPGEKISNNPQKKIAGLMRLAEKNKDYLMRNKPVQWRRNRVLIPYLLKADKKKEARRICIKNFILCPLRVKSNFSMIIHALSNNKF